MAIWIAVISAALAVPRPAAPTNPPAPTIDRRLIALDVDEARVLASQARQTPLPFEVRAVGELVRQYGKAEAADKSERSALLADLKRIATLASAKHPPRSLAQLLSVQTELFIEALKAWERGEATPELGELAGNLLARARKQGWLEDRHLLMTEAERRVTFRLRWLELTGLRGPPPLTPTLDDWRVYYGFLLEHPEGEDPLERGRKQLGYVAALGKRDPTYPVWLARGVILYQIGAFQEAADAFGAHLGEHPDGPYTLRAKNHLLAALAKVEGQE